MAADGQQGIEALEKHTYDLVLMDMQMPVMDGVTATMAIRANPRFDAMPIIAMTANVLAEERQRCMDAGMNDFVSKPILPDLLNDVLSRHLKPKPGTPLLAPRAAIKASHPVVEIEKIDEPAGSAPAIDVALGLRYSRGNQTAYEKLLGMFEKTARATELKFHEALARADYEVAQRMMHSIRGMAGTVGAVALANAAEAIESHFRKAGGQPSTELIECFKHALDAVLSHIEAGIFPSQESAAKSD